MGFGGVAVCAALLAATGAAAEPTLEIKQAVARVTIVPEDRADIVVQVVRSNGDFPLSVSRMGDQVVVSGNIGWRSVNCNGMFGRRQVTVSGMGTANDHNMPLVVVHTPRQVAVKAGGAVFGSIGRGSGVTLANAGCGDCSLPIRRGRSTSPWPDRGISMRASPPRRKFRYQARPTSSWARPVAD